MSLLGPKNKLKRFLPTLELVSGPSHAGDGRFRDADHRREQLIGQPQLRRSSWSGRQSAQRRMPDAARLVT
jgi:hypothetical protein